MRASSQTILYFVSGTDPGGLLIPWSQMLFFFSLFHFFGCLYRPSLEIVTFFRRYSGVTEAWPGRQKSEAAPELHFLLTPDDSRSGDITGSKKKQPRMSDEKFDRWAERKGFSQTSAVELKTNKPLNPTLAINKQNTFTSEVCVQHSESWFCLAVFWPSDLRPASETSSDACLTHDFSCFTSCLGCNQDEFCLNWLLSLCVSATFAD